MLGLLYQAKIRRGDEYRMMIKVRRLRRLVRAFMSMKSHRMYFVDTCETQSLAVMRYRPFFGKQSSVYCFMLSIT